MAYFGWGLVEPGHVALPDGPGVLWWVCTCFQMPRHQVVQSGDDRRPAFGDDASRGERLPGVEQHQGDHGGDIEIRPEWTSHLGGTTARTFEHAGHCAPAGQA